jgi:anti-anti-sigma regulatory factor
MAVAQGGSLVIRMDGVFDVESVHVIRERVESLSGDAEVYVDLSRVRDFHDHAVALLADVLSRAPARVFVRGLRQHQYRMLRYLGVGPGALDPGLSRPALER